MILAIVCVCLILPTVCLSLLARYSSEPDPEENGGPVRWPCWNCDRYAPLGAACEHCGEEQPPW